MIIYLIRHGESNANIENLVTGTPNDTLSEEGKSQVGRLAEQLNCYRPFAEHYVTSQWKRAQQTSMLLWPEANWEIDERVGETNAGEVARWSLQDFQTQYPDFNSDPAIRYPGGESHMELYDRVINWLYDQITRPVKKLVLVTHSGPISCILQCLCRVDMKAFPVFEPANASLTIVKMQRQENSYRGKIMSFSMVPLKNLYIFDC